MLKPAEFTFDDVTVGQTAEFSVTLTDELVAQFAAFSGDYNPLHMDEVYAAETPFGARVAHGMFASSFFSQLVGMHLPGRHALYLSQSLLFRKPCMVGTTVVVHGEVVQKTDAAKTITLHTEVRDTSGMCLIDGEALVRLLV